MPCRSGEIDGAMSAERPVAATAFPQTSGGLRGDRGRWCATWARVASCSDPASVHNPSAHSGMGRRREQPGQGRSGGGPRVAFTAIRSLRSGFPAPRRSLPSRRRRRARRSSTSVVGGSRCDSNERDAVGRRSRSCAGRVPCHGGTRWRRWRAPARRRSARAPGSKRGTRSLSRGVRWSDSRVISVDSRTAGSARRVMIASAEDWCRELIEASTVAGKLQPDPRPHLIDPSRAPSPDVVRSMSPGRPPGVEPGDRAERIPKAGALRRPESSRTAAASVRASRVRSGRAVRVGVPPLPGRTAGVPSGSAPSWTTGCGMRGSIGASAGSWERVRRLQGAGLVLGEGAAVWMSGCSSPSVGWASKGPTSSMQSVSRASTRNALHARCWPSKPVFEEGVPSINPHVAAEVRA